MQFFSVGTASLICSTNFLSFSRVSKKFYSWRIGIEKYWFYYLIFFSNFKFWQNCLNEQKKPFLIKKSQPWKDKI